ncbi:hypothetical protein GCM10010967_14670 [Dyadobacter beijingensis]|uniref:Uncharacterized protein n=1 Tax=Dyadobacter beijingensis TaxID=365489 RepID=A0ABQ2HLF5_9BACT|nr:hypothetical protein [Dyadobacter beijingensis]GGM83914.1 hypothetical protein GCM10010967_14670 [Dyadobacter beijingensis]
MKQGKTKYLSYIEETPKHYSELRDLAKIAASKAVTSAKAHNLPVTFVEDGWIVREDATGNQIKVSKIDKLPRKTRPGAKFRLP